MICTTAELIQIQLIYKTYIIGPHYKPLTSISLNSHCATSSTKLCPFDLKPSLIMTVDSSFQLMFFHLLFSTQNKCSLCFNFHVFLSPSPTTSAPLKINDQKTHVLFPPARGNQYNQASKLHVHYSQSHMYRHACTQEAKQLKQNLNQLAHEHHVTIFLYQFCLCAQYTHLLCFTQNK